MVSAPARKCSQSTASGRPCQAWAVRGSDPPACASHGGGRDAAAEAPGPDPAGGPDILQVIADLAAKQHRLSDYIDECLADGDTEVADIIRLLALHSQNASRLGRLLRDKQALSPDAEEESNAAIYQALDALAEEWGLDL